MRHGKKFNHLSRTDSHRKALLSSLATSLIVHKRITTTVAKAKALRIYVEPLLTKSKLDSTHSRRTVFSYLQDKNSVNILFRDVASKIAERAGGYTRIIKTGTRLGDNAEMCFIELVDYNEIYTAKAEIKKAKTTRRGRSGNAAPKEKIALDTKTGTEAFRESDNESVKEPGYDSVSQSVSQSINKSVDTHEEALTRPEALKMSSEKVISESPIAPKALIVDSSTLRIPEQNIQEQVPSEHHPAELLKDVAENHDSSFEDHAESSETEPAKE